MKRYLNRGRSISEAIGDGMLKYAPHVADDYYLHEPQERDLAEFYAMYQGALLLVI